ncbi:MAG: RagB/SusD family nutrient uptake outer membrane protein, partial [Tannerella sp.]|nr:RagB/SusD family nutrient uptake outer membrane protein [Tannerella sp.]
AGSMQEEKLNQYAAMAHFVRAFNYFWLVRFFNNMPKITTATQPDFTVTVSPKEEIYAFIIEDLQFAEQWLPVEWTGKKRIGGAPTQGAAKAMLAKVYLQMAGFPVNGGTEYYAKARDKAKEIIDNASIYRYILREHCADLWDPYWTLLAEDEAIYFCKGERYGEDNYTVRSPLACRPRENLGSTSGWEIYLAENYFFEHFPEGERKDATFVDYIYFKPTEDGQQEVKHYTEMAAKHPFYKKEWADDKVSDWSWDRMWETGDWKNGRSYIAIRYAEILLIYAEAQARAEGSPNALAYDCLNRIRNRAKAGLNSTGAEVSGLSAAAFLDSVVWERAWEFAGSESYCSRWFDLQRLELVEKAATEWRREPDAPIAQTPTKKQYFLQIPSAEVVKNPALNNNNPEY